MSLSLSRRLRLLLFVGLVALDLGALVATQRAVGFTRDEATYFQAARDYWPFWGDFLEALVPGSRVRMRDVANARRIDRTFGENSEHPALMKSLFGLSAHLFASGRRPLMKESTAMRLPAMVLGALTVGLVFLVGAELATDLAGLVGALLFAVLPRAFFHAHLACFDVPICAMTFATLWAYARSVRPREGRTGALAAIPWPWAVATGALFGLALATKINAFFVPVFLVPHAVFLLARRRARPAVVAAPFVSMAVLGPAVFYVHWPWLWHDTLARVEGYLAFFKNHSYYNIELLGRNYNHPPFPWYDPLVFTGLTTPTVTLLLAVAGLAWLLRDDLVDRLRGVAGADRRAPGVLLAMMSLPWIALFMTRTTPIFGAEKHWLPAMPVLCLAAGIAVERLALAMGRELALSGRRALLATATLGAVCVLPGLVETVRSHPEGLSYYTELAGGFAGGADLGMNRQFWGYTLAQALPWLNAHARPRSSIYLHDGSPAYDQYEREGMLRSDLYNAGQEEPAVQASQYAVIIYEKHMTKYELMIWKAYGKTRPSWVLTRDDVPLVAVYERDQEGTR